MEIMLGQRQEVLLASIIEEYVASAEPVSSRLLEKTGFFGLKSATIRAAMNDLEDAGYLTHRHTSGGRLPTDKAYRYFVDNLISEKRKASPAAAGPPAERAAKSEKDKKEISSAISAAGQNPHQINKNVAQTLSELSANLVITNIEEEDDFYKVGLSSLFEMPDFREFDKMFRLASFFDEFDKLFDKMERQFFADIAESFDDVKISIGRENPVREIKDETVMFAKYNLPYNYTGSLMLIGPTRMDYGRNIGLIRFITNELNQLAKRA